MKLSKEDLKKKITEVVGDEDTQISLLEDIEDSFVEPDEVDTVEKTTYDELETKYKDLQEKYKQRFLKGDDKKDAEEKKDEVDEELEEKEVIDIKEI
jgi:hypothetical protein